MVLKKNKSDISDEYKVYICKIQFEGNPTSFEEAMEALARLNGKRITNYQRRFTSKNVIISDDFLVTLVTSVTD
jgi:hypothetical protein